MYIKVYFISCNWCKLIVRDTDFQDYPLQYKKGLLLNFAEIMQEGKVANKNKNKEWELDCQK